VATWRRAVAWVTQDLGGRRDFQSSAPSRFTNPRFISTIGWACGC